MTDHGWSEGVWLLAVDLKAELLSVARAPAASRRHLHCPTAAAFAVVVSQQQPADAAAAT